MILLQRQPCQLVEMGQQAGQRPGPADMSPFRQPEVALQQHQLIRLGHYAGEGLDFGQIRGAGPAWRQAQLLFHQGDRHQLGARARLGQAQEEALRRVRQSFDGGVATAKTQLALPLGRDQHLVAAALALQSGTFEGGGIYVACQAEVKFPGGCRQLAQVESEPDVLAIASVNLGVDQGCRHENSSDGVKGTNRAIISLWYWSTRGGIQSAGMGIPRSGQRGILSPPAGRSNWTRLSSADMGTTPTGQTVWPPPVHRPWG